MNIVKFLGVLFIVVGLFLLLSQKIGLGRLPGDIKLQFGNFSFYFPITTCLLISAVLTLIFAFLFKK
jgi:hypothetical protein